VPIIFPSVAGLDVFLLCNLLNKPKANLTDTVSRPLLTFHFPSVALVSRVNCTYLHQDCAAKRKILLSFTHSHIVPNTYDFCGTQKEMFNSVFMLLFFHIREDNVAVQLPSFHTDFKPAINYFDTPHLNVLLLELGSTHPHLLLFYGEEQHELCT